MQNMNYVWCFISNFNAQAVNEPNQVKKEQSPSPQRVETPQSTAKGLVKKQESDSTEKSKVIVLKREDLIEAGYQVTFRTWTKEEDRLLLHYRNKKELGWNQVAQHLPNRTGRMCNLRYNRLSMSQKERWRRKDDEKLLRLVEQHGQDWREIATHFTRWNQLQIKQHYLDQLRPGLNRQQWTLQEDLAIIECVNDHGYDWAELQRRLPQRSLYQIKYRFRRRIVSLNEQKLKEERERMAVPNL